MLLFHYLWTHFIFWSHILWIYNAVFQLYIANFHFLFCTRDQFNVICNGECWNLWKVLHENFGLYPLCFHPTCEDLIKVELNLFPHDLWKWLLLISIFWSCKAIPNMMLLFVFPMYSCPLSVNVIKLVLKWTKLMALLDIYESIWCRL